MRREQQSAAGITDRVATRRDTIDLPGTDDVGQQRLVENFARRVADMTEDERERGERPGAFPGEIQKRRTGDSEGRESTEKLFLGSEAVGDGPEQGRNHRDDQQPDGLRIAPIDGAEIFRQSGGGHLMVVDRQNRRHHCRDEG